MDKMIPDEREMYCRRQWVWVFEKVCAGYTRRDVADFLGLSESCVADHFKKYGFRVPRGDLPPLQAYAKEFNSMALKEE